jgi:hypothetical protein
MALRKVRTRMELVHLSTTNTFEGFTDQETRAFLVGYETAEQRTQKGMRTGAWAFRYTC